MNYPDSVLDSLEREPIVYFGCTWSEIVNAVIRGALVSVPTTLVLVLLPWPFSRVIVVIPFFVIWLLVTRFTMSNLRKLRTGKPLFYEKHVMMLKRRNPFVNPVNLKQTERNRHA